MKNSDDQAAIIWNTRHWVPKRLFIFQEVQKKSQGCTSGKKQHTSALCWIEGSSYKAFSVDEEKKDNSRPWPVFRALWKREETKERSGYWYKLLYYEALTACFVIRALLAEPHSPWAFFNQPDNSWKAPPRGGDSRPFQLTALDHARRMCLWKSVFRGWSGCFPKVFLNEETERTGAMERSTAPKKKSDTFNHPEWTSSCWLSGATCHMSFRFLIVKKLLYAEVAVQGRDESINQKLVMTADGV